MGRVLADQDGVRAGLAAALEGPGAGAAADRLCASCVDLLAVDGAALSLFSGGAFFSVGASGSAIGKLDELQFTLGEGPSFDAVSSSGPVLVADLNAPDTARWSAFAAAAAQSEVTAVFALPVMVAGYPVGVLTLCRHRPGRFEGTTMSGAIIAAELAVLPLLDVRHTDLHAAVNDVGSPAWVELGSIMRSEVYQATGVLIAQLGVPPAEAMVRLRAHAFAAGMSASDVAYEILEHRLYLGDDGTRNRPGREL